MLRTLFWLSWFFGYLMIKVPRYWKVKRLGRQGKTEEQREMLLAEIKQWATRLLRNIQVKLVVEGIENLPPPEEPVVFACNHQSYMDVPVLLSGLDFPRPLLSKTLIGKVPFLGKWMRLLGCVFVEREDMRSSLVALRECERVVKNGQSIIIFPEGTRSMQDEMGPFKEGIVHIAVKAGARVVPLAIDGSHRVLEGSRYRLQKTTVRLVIMPPMETAGLNKAEKKALSDTLAEMIDTARRGENSHPAEAVEA